MFKTSNLLLTKPENIYYHTGFLGSYGFALLTKKGETYLFTDGRYALQAQKLCKKNTKIIIMTETPQQELSKIFKKHKITQLGFEANHLSYNAALKLRKEHKSTKLIPLDRAVDQLRVVKTEDELKLIKESQKLNEKVLQSVISQIKLGISEAEIAWQIYKTARDLGAETTSFDPIVAFGANSASPHYMAEHKRKLKKGDLILIDMGVKLNQYCSDMTRVFFTTKPTAEQKEVYNTVLNAQEYTIKNLRVGQKAFLGDKFARDIIATCGFGDYFTHANGHGIGLEIHEAPSLSSKPKHTDRNLILQENTVVTVEPGVYLPNKFGIRIEDMICLKANGTENFTKFPKKIEDMIIKL